MAHKLRAKRAFTLPPGRSRTESRVLARVRSAFAGSELERMIANSAREGHPSSKVIDLIVNPRPSDGGHITHPVFGPNYRMNYKMLSLEEHTQPDKIPKSDKKAPWWMAKLAPVTPVITQGRSWANESIRRQMVWQKEIVSDYNFAVKRYGKRRVDSFIRSFFKRAKAKGVVVRAIHLERALGKFPKKPI